MKIVARAEMDGLNQSLTLNKSKPQYLRLLNLNEGWLQQQIFDDPTLLGLGEVAVLRREKVQPTGGRLDFLLADYENDARYEVELMLGSVDESHIIRTIEYWDIERQRYPQYQHTAVIVAEDITSRFFNVIRLLNRAVPIMAIQLSAFRFQNEVILQFIRVLDTTHFGTGADDTEELTSPSTDRAYWEKRSSPLLSIFDAFVAKLPVGLQPRIAYNKNHIALATNNYNFAWFHPRKESWNGAVFVGMQTDGREEMVEKLNAANFDASLYSSNRIRLNVRATDLNQHGELITAVLQKGHEWAQR